MLNGEIRTIKRTLDNFIENLTKALKGWITPENIGIGMQKTEINYRHEISYLLSAHIRLAPGLIRGFVFEHAGALVRSP